MRKLYFSPQRKKHLFSMCKILSLAWNIVYWLPKSHRFEFFGVENTVFFEPKNWWKYDIYWLLKTSNFDLFENGIFIKQKMKRWYLLISEMFLFWTLRGWKIWSFIWSKKLMERWYLLITETFLFWAFPWWKIWSLLRQKVNGKMMFTDYWKVHILSFSVMRNTVFF